MITVGIEREKNIPLGSTLMKEERSSHLNSTYVELIKIVFLEIGNTLIES